MSPNSSQTETPTPSRKFTRKQRRHLIIAFLVTTIATLCILFGGQ